jgi:hypothetical protein
VTIATLAGLILGSGTLPLTATYANALTSDHTRSLNVST